MRRLIRIALEYLFPAIIGSIAGLASAGAGIAGLFGGAPNVPTGPSQPWWVQSLQGQPGFNNIGTNWIDALNNLYGSASGIQSTAQPGFQTSLNRSMGLDYSPYLNAASRAGQQYGGLSGSATDIGSMLANLSGQSTGMGNQAYSAGAGILPQLMGAGQQTNSALQNIAGGVLNTSMDPQRQLYERSLGDVTEQVRAGQAARGLGTSAVGGAEEDQALSNFNIDWQNQQLNRQIQGANTAGSLYGAGASALGGLTSAGAGAYGNLGGLGLQANQLGGNQLAMALSALSQVPGFTLQSGQVPLQAGQQWANAPGQAASAYTSGMTSALNPSFQVPNYLQNFVSGGGTGVPPSVPSWNPYGQAGAGFGSGLSQFGNSQMGGQFNNWLSNLFSSGGGGGDVPPGGY